VTKKETEKRAAPRRKTALTAERWQLDYLFDLGFQGWLVHIGVISLTAAFLFYALPGAVWPLYWAGLMAFFSAGLAGLSYYYVARQSLTLLQAERAGYLHTLLTGCVGITWGAGAFGAASGPFETLLVYSLALGGTALGAVSSQHAVLRSCFVSLWTSVPLLAAAHYIYEGVQLPAVNAAMIMLYAVILSILSLRMHGFLDSNRELTRQLDRRLGELTELTRELDIARREAEEANLSKSRFLAQASHDLRQPIHAISLFTACLRDSGLGQEEGQMVDNIDRSLESVSGLFRSLLDIAALDVGKIVPHAEPVQLADILGSVAQQNNETARQAGIALKIMPTSRWVQADQALLTTMIQNLVSNAVKYAPGAPLLIGARRRNGRIAIDICDGGPGIPSRDVPRVFDEFYRVEKMGAAGAEGLGLGLSIVKRLGLLMGLSVSLHSVPGRGTRVCIDGLDAVSPAPLKSAPRFDQIPHPLRGLRVLLIEDDEEVLNATSLLLGKWGCVVTPHTRPPAQKTDCDLIITDFDLADAGTAREGIAQVRHVEGRHIPAVIITGHSEDEVRGLIDDDTVPILPKPVRPAKLRSIITAQSLAREGVEAESGLQ